MPSRKSAQAPTSARWRSSTVRARSATIVAETETTCLMLTRKRFAKVLRGEPSVALALLGTLAARVRELEASPAD